MQKTGPAQHKLPAALVLGEHLGADDVGRQQVGRELNPLKLQMQRLGKRVDQGRFAQAGHAFQEHVAAAHHGQQHMLDDVVLADDELADFIADAVESRDEALDRFAGLMFRGLHRPGSPGGSVRAAAGE